jgi:hypothetical protein
MNGFITIAVGDEYLQRAVAFALSAQRFGYETKLLYRDTDPPQYESFFSHCISLSDFEMENRKLKPKIWEYKKLCYELSPEFDVCAFCDADSLVIKDPGPMFDLAATISIHTPGGRALAADEKWAVASKVTTREIADTVNIPPDVPIQALNGGFLLWKRSAEAKQWFQSFRDFFAEVNRFYQSRKLHQAQAREELCMALAFAKHSIDLPKSDTSIGIWDAHHLKIDIAKQRFECQKAYYWQGHRFSPYIAHFGGGSISQRYRNCVKFLTTSMPVELPLFEEANSKEGPRFNAFSITRQDYQSLLSFLKEHKIETVLEFGPGASTWCFAEAGCEVDSFEHKEKWHRQFTAAFQHNPKIRIHEYQNDDPIEIPELEGKQFDLAFVDSPNGVSGNNPEACSRLNTCEAAARYVQRVILHDAQRGGEQNTLSLFAERGWMIESIDPDGKMALLSKPSGSRGGQASLVRPHADVNDVPSSRWKYDFSHWESLPRVSCQCITYGRTTLLDEAVESFLRQDYPGEKELEVVS